MYILTVFLPFINFVIIALFSRFIGNLYIAKLSILSILISCILSLIMMKNIASGTEPVIIDLGSWLNTTEININFTFLYDTLTIVMFVLVTFISTMVYIFSYGHMNDDPHLPRFMAYLSLFSFLMLLLVSSGNFFLSFAGWEGVGLSSYPSINPYSTRLQANKSALKAVFTNRIGDFFLFIALITIFYTFNTLDMITCFAISFNMHEFVNIYLPFLSVEISKFDLIAYLLLFAAMTKSAQLPLHVWLPDAMEGPTPVPALIHAATMVTAGILLLVRCSTFIELAHHVKEIIIIIGALTAIFGASVAVVQNDIKKIIAYSTCSQLGYMMIAVGLSGHDIAIYHLFNHGFFKALLFLTAGCIIHALENEQDIRRMGGLANILPLCYKMTIIGSLSLMGFPFLSGFYSKDLIMEIAYSSYSTVGIIAFITGNITAFLTSLYSTRLIFLVFLTKPNGHKSRYIKLHEGGFSLTFPLVMLAISSILSGYMFHDLFVGIGSSFRNNAIFINTNNNLLMEAEFIPTVIKLLPTFLSIQGILFGIFTYYVYIDDIYKLPYFNFGKYIHYFLTQKWYFDLLYNTYIIKLFLEFCHKLIFKLVDRGLYEFISTIIIVKISSKFSYFIQNINNISIVISLFKFVILFTLVLMSFLYLSRTLFYIIFISICIFITMPFFVQNDSGKYKKEKNEYEKYK